jgi:hypothetical protein
LFPSVATTLLSDGCSHFLILRVIGGYVLLLRNVSIS